MSIARFKAGCDEKYQPSRLKPLLSKQVLRTIALSPQGFHAMRRGFIPPRQIP